MEDEQKILKTLNDFGRLPSSRLSAIIGINYSYLLPILQKMNDSRKVRKIEETTATYWEITETGKKAIVQEEQK